MLFALFLFTNNLPCITQAQKIIPSARHAANSVSVEDFAFTEYADSGATKRFTIEGKRLGPEARRLNRFLKTGVADTLKLRDVRVTFYNNNSPASFINSKTAELDSRYNKENAIDSLTGRVSLEGDVSVETRSHKTLSCNKMLLDNAKRRLIASGNCVLRYEGKFEKADYIDSDVLLQDFTCRKDKEKRLRALAKIFI